MVVEGFEVVGADNTEVLIGGKDRTGLGGLAAWLLKDLSAETGDELKVWLEVGAVMTPEGEVSLVFFIRSA